MLSHESTIVGEVERTAMVLRPLKLLVHSLSHPYWFRTLGLLCLLLVSCSGLGILFKKLRWWIWRIILDEDVQLRNIRDEATTMAAATAVKAASSAVAQVACLSQVMLTFRAKEKQQTKNLFSALQAVSLKLTKAELTMRGFVDKLDRTNALSATNGISVEKPQPAVQNSTFQTRSFLKVMAMLERGETPPGIKKINDKPPIPNQLPSVSCLQPKPKPWEMKG